MFIQFDPNNPKERAVAEKFFSMFEHMSVDMPDREETPTEAPPVEPKPAAKRKRARRTKKAAKPEDMRELVRQFAAQNGAAALREKLDAAGVSTVTAMDSKTQAAFLAELKAAL